MPVVSARYGDGRLLAQAYIGPHAGRQQVARQRGRRPTLKVAQLSSATASGQRSATSLASMIRRYIIWRNNHACRFMISWCQAGRVGGPGGGFSFASIAWRPRTSRAVQFNFTGRQVALQAGRRPDPLDPRHAGQVVQGRPRCPLNIAVHRRHYSTAGSGRRSGVGPRPKSGRSSGHSTANSRPGFASPLPTRWRPASGPGSDDGLTTRRASTVEKLPAACRSCDRQARRGQAQGPDGPAGAESPGRALGIAVGPFAAAASAQHQAYKIARPRGTAPLAAGS
jgi:hypothetical protein